MSIPYYVRIKEITELKNNYRVWKVHLLGELSTNYKTGEMSIMVWLVPLINPKQFKNGKNHHLLVENKHYNFREGKQIEVGVGGLPLLTPGTIFIDGFSCVLPKYITAKFEFTVTEKNQTIISTGSYWKKENGKTRYYIPREQFQLFDTSRQNQSERKRHAKPFASKGLVLHFLPEERPKIKKDTYFMNQNEWKNEIADKKSEVTDGSNFVEVHGLIFFSIEIIRFYYTYSSQSCQEILSDALAGIPNRLFKPLQTSLPDNNGRGGELRLSQYITNDDWQILVRPAFDSYALSEFRRPYISGLKNKIFEGSFLPEAKFPFRNQKTKLTVHGRYVQSGNRVYFLVYWIEHCTASFPYVDVKYSRDNPGEPRKNDASLEEDDSNLNSLKGKHNYEEKHEKQRRYFSTCNPNGMELQNEAPPGTIRHKIKILLNEMPRFDYVLKHPATKIVTIAEKKDLHKTEKGIFIGIPEGLEGGGTARASGSRPISHTSLVPNSEKKQGSTDFNDWKIHELTQRGFGEEVEKFSEDETENHNFKNQEFVVEESKSELKEESVKRQKKLPINLNNFKKILNVLEKNEEILNKLQKVFKSSEVKDIYEENIETRMIAILPTGEIASTDNAILLPSFQNQGEGAIIKSDSPKEVFLAEITDKNKEHYAYLLDIEALKSRTNKIQRSFQMFLCFVKSTSNSLSGAFLQDKILKSCVKYSANWEEAFKKHKTDEKFNGVIINTADDQGKQQQISLKVYFFKHNLDNVNKYAARILKVLHKGVWILPNSKKN